MTVWTIGWWTQAERERAANALAPALHGWGEQWGLDAEMLGVVGESAVAFDCVPTGWLRLTGSGDRDSVWLTHPDATVRALGAVLCDDAGDRDTVNRHGSALSLAVARRAVHALAATLCAHFDWTVADDDAPCAVPDGLARGGLRLSLSIAGATLTLLLSAGVARAVASRQGDRAAAPLRSLPQVIGQRTVMLDVALRPVRLDIGSLCSLAVGDVIALDHKLDESVALLAGDGSPVADAHLARIGPDKAIRFGRASS